MAGPYFEDLFNSVSPTNGLTLRKPLTIAVGGALVAGGAPAIYVNTPTIGPNIYTGSGVPTVTAPKGSLYLRSDGSSTSTRMYVNTDGATTWTSCTTAA